MLKTPLKVGDTLTLTFRYPFTYVPTEEELHEKELEQEREKEAWRIKWEIATTATMEFMGEDRPYYEGLFDAWYESGDPYAAQRRQQNSRYAPAGVLAEGELYVKAEQLEPETYEGEFFDWLLFVSGLPEFDEIRWTHLYSSTDDKPVRYVYDQLTYKDINITVTTQQQLETPDEKAKPRSAVFRVPYTLTGILESYSDRWDSSVYALPNAFITNESAEKIMRAYKVIPEKFPKVPAFTPAYFLFARSNSLSARELFSAFLPAYEAIITEEKPVYRILAYSMDIGGSGRSGSVSCVVYGIDEETGDPVYLEATGYMANSQDEDTRLSLTYKGMIFSFTADDMLSGNFSVPGLLPPPSAAAVTLEEVDKDNTSPLRVNTYAYPPSASAGNTLKYVVSGIIVVTTACAVFQIYLTQLKRRTRRLALLKAIGATNAQLFFMFFCELFYLLLLSLPLGLGIGLGLAYAAVKLLPAQGVLGALLYSVDWQSLGIGLAGGALALVAGASYPMLRALKTPLTGAVSGQKKTRAVRRVQDKKFHTQSFSAIMKRNARANPGRTRGNFALCAFILSILLACVFLCFNAFERYNTTVLLNDKPDYRIDAPYGMGIRYFNEFMELLSATGEAERVEPYKAAENVYLCADGLLENSPVLTAFEKSLPSSVKTRFFEAPSADRLSFGLEEDEVIPLSLKTDVLGIPTDGELFERFLAAITEGEIDRERFEKGEEVILLVPMYQNGVRGAGAEREADAELYETLPHTEHMSGFLKRSGIMELSYSKSKFSYYQADTTVRVGDELTVGGVTRMVSEFSEDNYTYLRQIKVKVGAVIRYFPDTGIWPFSDNGMGYLLVGNFALPTKIYDKADLRLDAAGAKRFELMAGVFYPDSRGKTYFYVYGNDKATRENTDLALLSLARDYGFRLNNYRETNKALYNEAFNNAFLIGLLGFTAAMIALTILLNTLESTAEQERARAGVLQSMGVRGRQFIGAQIGAALKTGLLSLLAANIFLALLLFAFALVNNSGLALSVSGLFSAVFESLWLFPWGVYLGISALFLVILVFLYVQPIKKVLKYSPIENIRG